MRDGGEHAALPVLLGLRAGEDVPQQRHHGIVVLDEHLLWMGTEEKLTRPPPPPTCSMVTLTGALCAPCPTLKTHTYWLMHDHLAATPFVSVRYAGTVCAPPCLPSPPPAPVC